MVIAIYRLYHELLHSVQKIECVSTKIKKVCIMYVYILSELHQLNPPPLFILLDASTWVDFLQTGALSQILFGESCYVSPIESLSLSNVLHTKLSGCNSRPSIRCTDVFLLPILGRWIVCDQQYKFLQRKKNILFVICHYK